MTTNKIPLYIDNPNYSLYGNLGERIAAGLLDGVFLAPATIVMMYFNSMDLYNFYYTFVITQLIILGYYLYLPMRYGATPGKRVMGLTILKLDGSALSYRDAFLKHLPMLFMGLFAFVVQCFAMASADATTFNSLSWIEQSKYLQSVGTFPSWIQLTVIYSYSLSNLLLVWKNSRSRSISDWVAGTVVVYTKCLAKIEEYKTKEEAPQE
ncbi:RDD family protein [Flavobacterium sp. 25HG05S-40]|uniref:RDD family protein n=1 Tax=Flavobacterium sp. 25HG05S-40 TaxID=3458682 RepID=UPI004044C1F3